MTRTRMGRLTIQHFLGRDTELAATPLQGLGSIWDIGIGGFGYLFSTLGNESPFEYRAITTRGAPAQKPRIDTAGEPGEQTLERWWARAQHSWHGGAGQRIFDSTDSSRFAFHESKGIDIWSKGQVSLLKRTFTVDSGAFTDYYLLADAGVLFMAENGTIYKITNMDTHPTGSSGSVMGGPTAGSSLVQSMTSDGKFLYVCWDPSDAAGIRRQEIASWSGGTLVNQLNAEVIEYVKSRLMATKANIIYDIDPAAGTSIPAPFYTHPITNWRWTAISGTATAIYYAGFSGERSEIYAARLDATDLAAGLTLGVPTSVWQAPDGEIIYSIEGYLGKALLIGTSRGLRIGFVANVEDELDVSRLLVDTPFAVKAIEPQGDYAWFAWSKFDGTDSGLGRIDLATLAYASDLMATNQGSILSIASFQNRMVFSTSDLGTNVVSAEHLTELVPSGHYETGEIRFDTFEKKRVRFFDTLITGNGTFDLDIRKDFGSFVQYLDNFLTGEVTQSVGLIGTRFTLKITLNRDLADATLGPRQLEWRLRGEPFIDGLLEYLFPLMTYDFLTTHDGIQIGKPGMAKEIRDRLVFLWRNNVQTIMESRDFGTLQVQITGIEFKSFTPPQGADGMGGITLIVVQEQE